MGVKARDLVGKEAFGRIGPRLAGCNMPKLTKDRLTDCSYASTLCPFCTMHFCITSATNATVIMQTEVKQSV